MQHFVTDSGLFCVVFKPLTNKWIYLIYQLFFKEHHSDIV